MIELFKGAKRTAVPPNMVVYMVMRGWTIAHNAPHYRIKPKA